jgi:beta-galactosidase
MTAILPSIFKASNCSERGVTSHSQIVRRGCLAALLLLTSARTSLLGYSHYTDHAAISSDPPALLLGSAWYPEQWPEARWDADLDLMQKAHLHVVRIGEFAWTALEPREGDYQLDWLERAVNRASTHGIYVILGTPTGAPPVWMAMKYPDILVTDSNGKQYKGATRNRYNWNSSRYRDFVRDIDERLAKRFGRNPNVIGWQIDNEYSKASFDADTQKRFQAWLKIKYQTIDRVNQAWTASYNNQTYSAWDEIPLVDGTADNSPGLWLDSKRFISESLRGYQKVQIDAIRKYADSRQKITTNMMGWFDLYDHYTVAQDLDIVGWDNPQVWGSFDPVCNGAAHDLMRGLKGGNYWVLESTAGPRGGENASVMLNRGEMRAAIWSYVGHGADLVSYWQWRDALNGGEQNHGAIVDVDGEPDPIYSEYKQIGGEFEKVAPYLKDTHVVSDIAILQSYPSRWAINWQKMNPVYDPINELMSYYVPLHKLGFSIDILPPDRDLSSYKMVVAPGLNLLTQSEAENLTSYVKNGGHLVLGQRSAMKDENNSRWPQRQPGPLASLLGARIEQYTALSEPISVSGVWGDAKAQIFAEQIKVLSPDTTVLARYQAPQSWLDNEPAAVTRKVGAGSITYIGAWLDTIGMEIAVRSLASASRLPEPTLLPPDGVEIYWRIGKKQRISIIENLSSRRQRVELHRSMNDLLSGERKTSIDLPSYGVSVLGEPKP